MKYFKKRMTLGSNKEKLLADVLKLLFGEKVKPEHSSNFYYKFWEVKNKNENG